MVATCKFDWSLKVAYENKPDKFIQIGIISNAAEIPAYEKAHEVIRKETNVVDWTLEPVSQSETPSKVD